MADLTDKGKIVITGHILIYDTETKEILINESESSLVKEKISLNRMAKNNDF